MKTNSSPKECLKTHFGYDAFRPLQEEIIHHVLDGGDALVLMPTGGGKSVCYQIPALLLDGLTLVVSPLISLMKDQVDGLKSLGIEADYINSSCNDDHENRVLQDCASGKVNLLYVSPEKAVAAMYSSLVSLPIQLIVIDEAHCVSQWGHDFRPVYKDIQKLRQVFPKAQMMALTATADRLTRLDILNMLGLKQPKEFVSSFDRPNIRLEVRFGVAGKKRKEQISDFVKLRSDLPGIVYCLSRASCEDVTAFLVSNGVTAAAYHAGLSSEVRSKVQEDFLMDEVQVVVATIAFGMGIDKSNVRWVIHYNLPKSMESYYQEIGRCGRDGASAETLLYYSYGDLVTLQSFANQSGQVEINTAKLDRMKEYAEAKICRRKILLNYFSENLQENCGNCDICQNPPSTIDGLNVAQMAISALIRAERLGQKMAMPLLVDVLRGSHSQEVLAAKLDTIKTFGAGRSVSQIEWLSYLIQLLQMGAIEIAYEDRNHLRIAPFGHQLLQGSTIVSLVKFEFNGKKESTSEKKKKSVSASGVPSSTGNEKLYSSLKETRLAIAREKGLAPYLIFHDKTLQEMAEKCPINKEEFLEVAGISNVKWEKYGATFLEVILSATSTGKTKHTHQLTQSPAVSSALVLNKDAVKKWFFEMVNVGLSPSAHKMAQTLLAKNEEYQMLSFFGKGKDAYPLVALRNKIAPLMEEEELKWELKRNQIWEEYLKRTLTEDVPEEEWTTIRKELELLPKKERNTVQSEKEVTNPNAELLRAGEPWTEVEKKYLNHVIDRTNKIQKIQIAFQRSELSIRIMIVKLLHDSMLESEKSEWSKNRETVQNNV
jgi:ATP-dependent DNA helicase RecQ